MAATKENARITLFQSFSLKNGLFRSVCVAPQFIFCVEGAFFVVSLAVVASFCVIEDARFS